ncbi:MAG: S-layer homology domain-containing protein [Clostridia bacterium]|nr:S-layer homology domain-containing protein [Clostridia bacterium]
MKKTKKFLSVLLCTVMLMCVLSAGFTSYAKPLTYKVWVNGEQFDEFTLEIACGEGKASFDPETSTLYLEEAEITKGYEYLPEYVSAIYSELDNLNICLKGYNTIKLEGITDCDGIDCAPGCDITLYSVPEEVVEDGESISNLGMLDIVGGYYGTYIGGWEKEGGNLTVRDCYLWVWETAAAGIWVNHNISIENAMVNVIRTKQEGYNGIVSNVGGTISVSKGMVDVINNSSAFLLGNGDSSSHKLAVDAESSVQAHSLKGYAIEFVPDSETGAVNGEIQLLNGNIAAQCGEGKLCTNIPADKITTATDKEILNIVGGLDTEEKTLAMTVDPFRPFPDVKESAWYYGPVKYNAQRGLITGYQNGKFGPSDNIKRQDFAVILARFNDVNLEEYDTGEPTEFSDVAPNAYYAPAVRWAYENEIIMGYQNGKFGVGDNITREQICTILYRFFVNSLGFDGPDTDGREPDEILAPYADRGRISSWAYEGVAWCVEHGLMSGKNASTLAPTANCARAEAATLFMNAEKYQAQYIFMIVDSVYDS